MLHKSNEGQQMCLVATAFSFRNPFPFAPDLCRTAAQGCFTICTFQGEGFALRFSIPSTLLRLKESSFLLLLVAHLFPCSGWRRGRYGFPCAAARDGIGLPHSCPQVFDFLLLWRGTGRCEGLTDMYRNQQPAS